MRNLIREIYNKGREKDGRFESVSYEMHKKTIFEKELKKTYYLEDKVKRLETVRSLLKTKENSPTIDNLDENRLIIYCRNNDIDYQNLKNNRLFYNVWVAIGYVRELEIEVYIQNIYNKADELINVSKYDAICYLIDEQFKYHKNLFDSEYHDVMYSDEYNSIIFELLQNKIFKISEIEYEPISTDIERVIRKPLVWKSKITAIGTLFGLLKKNNIIDGSKADIVRALNSMFDNLNENTLTNNVKLHVYKEELKHNYDTETETLSKELMQYLKNSIPKQ